ncbi:MAG: hypothetical protein PHX86_08765 [Caldisericia bacterium]|nr:hypothetical protein [Caldisericia bacterium]
MNEYLLSKDKQIKKIRRLFEETENIQKSSGFYGGKLFFPIVNELRYCGNHVLNALALTNAEDIDCQLMEAEDHCNRAKYDAYECSIIVLTRKFEKFYDIYKTVGIPTIIPNFVEFIKLNQSLQDFFRTNNKISIVNSEEKDKFLRNGLKQLIDNIKTLELIKPEADRKLTEIKNRIRKDRLKFLMGSILIPLVIAFITVILTIR